MKTINTLFISALITFGIFTSAFAEHHGKKKDIIDTAVTASDFSTLVAAVKAADLVDTLKDKSALANILTYHVVSGKVTAADVVTLSEAMTVQGQKVTITVKDGLVYVNDAKVIATDIMASNGLIHVLDSVILPK